VGGEYPLDEERTLYTIAVHLQDRMMSATMKSPHAIGAAF